MFVVKISNISFSIVSNGNSTILFISFPSFLNIKVGTFIRFWLSSRLSGVVFSSVIPINSIDSSPDGDGDGFTGFVHQTVIDNYLNHHENPEDIEVYFCGPPLMNQAIEKMADDFGVPPENVRFDDFGG